MIDSTTTKPEKVWKKIVSNLQ